MDLLEGLNKEQRDAAQTAAGPLLILAGAGSGKTKTLTHRVALLIAEHKVWPSHILAVTFTNKAAKEMRERLAELLKQPNDRNFMPWMGTFHSICVRLLRMDGAAIEVPRNFVIYDEDDRQGLIKQVMKSLSISDKEMKPSAVSGAISSAKNALLDPEAFEASAQYPFQKNVAKVYFEYEKRRRTAKALDFDDLLIEAVRLLRDHKEIREKWRVQFEYILIDEYQDTNAAQYQLVKLLVNDQQNICVVGDDWQSIYSWRGADFTNILNFERDFPGWEVLRIMDSSIDAAMAAGKFRYENGPQAWYVTGQTPSLEFSQYVDTYLTEWTGFVAETVFDVNCLVLDEENVIFSAYNKQVFDFCKRHRINPIISELRHSYFWDGGISCCTQDLRRRGGLETYL